VGQKNPGLVSAVSRGLSYWALVAIMRSAKRAGGTSESTGLRLTGLVPAGLRVVCERVIKRGRMAGSVRWRGACKMESW
jgi:hypothetical protein